MPTNTPVPFDGVTYAIPNANEENWASLSTYLLALSRAAVSGGSQSLNVRFGTTATVTAATTDAILLISRAGAVAVNLPAGVDKQVLWIADVSGAAETNNITINRNGSNTIFGGTSYVLNQNNQATCFVFSIANGNWNRIAETKLPANGAAATLLKSDGTKLAYAKLVNADVDAAAAIARTKIASGTADHVVINDGSGVLSSEALLAVTRGGTGVATSTGSGSNVLNTSPTLVTPVLGTPSSGNLSSCTDLPLTTGVSGILPIANGGTNLSALGSALQILRVNAGATGLEFATVSGLGDVVGPSGGVVNNEIVLFASATGKAVKGIGAVGTTGQFLGTPFGTPQWTNQGSRLALTDAADQLQLGSGATRTIITSPAKGAASTYTIPDAGATASFVMNKGTNVIGGTLTLPATVNYTGVGSIVKAGAGDLTLSASGAFTLTVPATGTANLIDVAQTVSALKTFSAGLAVSGGTAATQVLSVSGTTWTVGNGPTITEAGAATFATSVTSPLIVGGSSVSQVLTIKSTTGIGTSDRIDFVVGNNGAVTGLSIGTAGQVAAGPTGSVSTSLQHVFNLPNANSYSSIASTGVNSIRFAALANSNAIISGKSTTNNVAGLAFIAGTADTNSFADMYFQVLENDNTDFATQTNIAYAWYNGAGAAIKTATRAGAWTAGTLTGSAITHNLQGGATNSALSDVLRLTQLGTGATLTGLLFSGRNTSAAVADYARIANLIEDSTAGTHSGGLKFYTALSGTLAEKGSVTSAGAWALGASGGTALHGLNTAALTTSTAAGVSYLRITINGSVRRIPTYNDA